MRVEVGASVEKILQREKKVKLSVEDFYALRLAVERGHR